MTEQLLKKLERAGGLPGFLRRFIRRADDGTWRYGRWSVKMSWPMSIAGGRG
jgi:hypothetical protein